MKVWIKEGPSFGPHELNLASLPLPYDWYAGEEGGKTSLPAGTYRFRLEDLANNVGGIGNIVAESDMFVVPGVVTPIPICTIVMSPKSSDLGLIVKCDALFLYNACIAT